MSDSMNEAVRTLQSADWMAASEGDPPKDVAPNALDAPAARIDPSTGWQLVNVREPGSCCELFFFVTKRDVKIRHRQTVPGAARAILQLLIMVFVFRLMGKGSSSNIPYAMFGFAALVAGGLYFRKLKHSFADAI
jgi:hypothetical protein